MHSDISPIAKRANQMYRSGDFAAEGFHSLSDRRGLVFFIALKKGEETYTFTIREDMFESVSNVLSDMANSSELTISKNEIFNLSLEFTSLIEGVREQEENELIEKSLNIFVHPVSNEDQVVDSYRLIFENKDLDCEFVFALEEKKLALEIVGTLVDQGFNCYEIALLRQVIIRFTQMFEDL